MVSFAYLAHVRSEWKIVEPHRFLLACFTFIQSNGGCTKGYIIWSVVVGDPTDL